MDEKEVQTTTTGTASPRPELPRNHTADWEIKAASRNASVAVEAQPKAQTERLENGGWESDNLIFELEKQLEATGYKKGFLDLEFKDPRHFTWLLVAFASMGGLLSGLDQSLISGANLTLPGALHLNESQVSMVNSGMPLGGKLPEIYHLGVN
jgi:hypothetical protein